MKTKIFLLLAIVCAVFIGFTSQSIAISIPKLKVKVASETTPITPYQQLSSVEDKGPVVIERVRALSAIAHEILREGDDLQEKSFTMNFDDGNRTSTLLVILKRITDKAQNQGMLQISVASLHAFDQESMYALPLFQLNIFATEKQMAIAFEIETNTDASLQTGVPKRIAPRGGLVSISDDEQATIRQIEIPGSTLPPLPEFDEAELWNMFSRTELNISEILLALQMMQVEEREFDRIKKARERALLQVLSHDFDIQRNTVHIIWENDVKFAQQNRGGASVNTRLILGVILIFGGILLAISGKKTEV